jgi:protein-S-isoprenylcysteine O-methyltransferase Ste14
MRVPLGFVAGAAAWWLAHPSWRSIAIGLPVAIVGEAIRVWAAGHLEKGREVTRSGPYRLAGHPLYFGSMLMGIGLAIGAASILVAALVIGYLVVMLSAAMVTEERDLREQFGADYDTYRAGRSEPVARRFSFARVRQNREYRALVGLAAAFVLLALKVA